MASLRALWSQQVRFLTRVCGRHARTGSDGKRGVDHQKFGNQVIEFTPGMPNDAALGIKSKYQLPLLEKVWEICYAAKVRLWAHCHQHFVSCPLTRASVLGV